MTLATSMNKFAKEIDGVFHMDDLGPNVSNSVLRYNIETFVNENAFLLELISGVHVDPVKFEDVDYVEATGDPNNGSDKAIVRNRELATNLYGICHVVAEKVKQGTL